MFCLACFFMYYYIYDIFTKHNKYKKLVDKIETTVTAKGIAGKNYRLTVLKNIEDVVDDAITNGIKNIIVVGNDQTISKVAHHTIDKDIALGIIPIGEDNLLAENLGIKTIEDACDIISARNIMKLDIGLANDQYFLFSIEPNSKNVIFDFDDYKITPKDNNEIMGVYNINITDHKFKSQPNDGIMEMIFSPKKRRGFLGLQKKEKRKDVTSIFPVKELRLKHIKKSATINIDRQKTIKTPVTVKLLEQKLNMIVGKKRLFE